MSGNSIKQSGNLENGGESPVQCSSSSRKARKIIELFAEKMVLELWCEVIYGVPPKTIRKSKKVWTSGEPADWLSLPQEIWLTIFSYLPQAELYFNVHRVCKTLNILCRDISLWKNIDFHKMHEDLESMNENATTSSGSAPTRVTKAHFTNLLTVFRDHVTSCKMSRFVNDYTIHDATLHYLCMCTSLRKLDLGFCDDVNLPLVCRCCQGIVELNLEGCSNLQDDAFTDVIYLERLEKLSVCHCASLTNLFLLCLYSLPNLRALNCDGVMRITEMGFIEFFQQQPRMEVLVLDGEDMSDDLVIYASQLPYLVVFELSFSQTLTSQSVYCFEGKYQLEKLKFRKASEITGYSICKVFNPDATFQLRSFAITECENMDDDALTCISRSCPHLKSLTLDWCWKLSDKGLCEVVNNCKKLQRLSLVGLFGIEGVGWLDNLDKRLPYLQFLDVSDCNNMPDEDLVDLVYRKRTIEAYSYYHDRVYVSNVTSLDDSDSETNSNSDDVKPETMWICPGERGVEVVF